MTPGRRARRRRRGAGRGGARGPRQLARGRLARPRRAARAARRRAARGGARAARAGGSARRPRRRDLAARLEAAGRPLGLDVARRHGGQGRRRARRRCSAARRWPRRFPAACRCWPPLGAARRRVPRARPAGSHGACARRARARWRGELPDLLDLLRVCVEAGLPLGRALREVGAPPRRRAGGASGARAAAQLELGVPRAEALARSASLAARCRRSRPSSPRCDRAERHGAPLGGHPRRAGGRGPRRPRAPAARAGGEGRAEDPARRRPPARAGRDAARRRGAGGVARSRWLSRLGSRLRGGGEE